MTPEQIAQKCRDGESSWVEFKEEAARPEKIAQEIVGLLNFQGGVLLLGVADDGAPQGLTGTNRTTEEHVMNIARTNIDPPFIPGWEVVEVASRRIGVIAAPNNAPDKPYKALRGSAWQTFIRVGSTTRVATREEEARLYYAGQLAGSYTGKPVPNARLEDLDMRRIQNYFRDIRHSETPPEEERREWERLLCHTEFMEENNGLSMPTIAGLVLFGRQPSRHFKRAGISAAAYSETIKEHATQERQILRYPLVRLFDAKGSTIETGLVEEAMAFARRNTRAQRIDSHEADLRERWDYPLEAVREALVNAIIHRDYTIPADIEFSIYSNRMEIISPGTLPNTITIERMKAGCRAARNELIKDTMRDYRYVEDMGLGVSRTIIPSMRRNGNPEAEFILEETRFTVRLNRTPR